ncbi:ring-hydroxylating dioxygenase subunit beta [Novosphingobium marinum]|uniref:3-phenylpropionate/cinnamic acid dioxygenase small subunit n=1 Tax=Novosphingobium marinum TaxID=1514948 RepID=A0A7Y9XYX1_9SPHN|nr:aromatic-ring-hydroxylating dioxygenase subunit beta [Novosphingobium marinum]NYH97167.1 3-phenylpropionate/cinnamic acid dioxygenase small subunit [Novosphingobium marinum]GGC44282.1 ring-hydroxylating dioxygenase subunit beta [Novosphingobium marinum]
MADKPNGSAIAAFTGSPTAVAVTHTSALYADVAAFIFREAELMDGHCYDEWFDLWAPEALYWVPSNSEDLDPDKSVSIIYERYDQLADRIFRLKDKRIHSQNPKSRLLRIVSNIIAEADGEDVLVRSNFILGEVRSGHQEALFGRATYRLFRREGGWKIRAKKVYLLNNDAPMRNVTFLL